MVVILAVFAPGLGVEQIIAAGQQLENLDLSGNELELNLGWKNDHEPDMPHSIYQH